MPGEEEWRERVPSHAWPCDGIVPALSLQWCCHHQITATHSGRRKSLKAWDSLTGEVGWYGVNPGGDESPHPFQEAAAAACLLRCNGLTVSRGTRLEGIRRAWRAWRASCIACLACMAHMACFAYTACMACMACIVHGMHGVHGVLGVHDVHGVHRAWRTSCMACLACMACMAYINCVVHGVLVLCMGREAAERHLQGDTMLGRSAAP